MLCITRISLYKKPFYKKLGLQSPESYETGGLYRSNSKKLIRSFLRKWIFEIHANHVGCKIKAFYPDKGGWFPGKITWFLTTLGKLRGFFEYGSDDYISPKDINGVDAILISYSVNQFPLSCVFLKICHPTLNYETIKELLDLKCPKI